MNNDELTAIYTNQLVYRTTNPYIKYEQLLSYYALFLIIIGTLSNIISILIMLRRSMRAHAYTMYLRILAISDTIILYQWNFDSFYRYNISKPPFFLDLDMHSLVICRLLSFLAFFSLQFSAWLLSLVSIDRAMTLYSLSWKNVMHKRKNIKISIAFIGILLFALNSHLLFLNGYKIENSIEFKQNLTNIISNSLTNLKSDIAKFDLKNEIEVPDYTVICYQSLNDKQYIFPKWNQAHLFLYSIIPYTSMFISNAFIIRSLIASQKVKSSVKGSIKRKKRVTTMLIVITVAFIILTLPSVIVHTFLRRLLINKPYRRLVNLCVNNLLHTSHAINFFLYVFSAPNFRQELITILKNIFNKTPSTNQTVTSSIVSRRVTIQD